MSALLGAETPEAMVQWSRYSSLLPEKPSSAAPLSMAAVSACDGTHCQSSAAAQFPLNWSPSPPSKPPTLAPAPAAGTRRARRTRASPASRIVSPDTVILLEEGLCRPPLGGHARLRRNVP